MANATDPRLRQYATWAGLTLAQARRQLLTTALDQWQAQQRGGAGRAARLSPETRSAIARTAAAARWGRRRADTGPTD